MRRISKMICLAYVLANAGGGCLGDDDLITDDAEQAVTGSRTIHNVYITWYGFSDNSCQVSSAHNCNTIAFPRNAGFPTRHDIATEDQGTFDNPITFATAARGSGSTAEFPVGSKIYVPLVRKYFVMEDQCFECGQEWFNQNRHSPHVDLWMGPSFGSADGPLTDCEEKLTLGSPFHGTGTIVANPARGLAVDTHPLFTHNQCTAHTF